MSNVTFDLKATLGAYVPVTQSVLANYIPEAPADGLLYGRQDKTWAPLIFNYLYEGAYNATSIDLDGLKALQFKKPLASNQTTATFVGTLATNSYVWFCSTVAIKSIIDSNTGFGVDYIKQNDTVTIDIDGHSFTFYCYRTTNQLIASDWEFIISFVTIA